MISDAYRNKNFSFTSSPSDPPGTAYESHQKNAANPLESVWVSASAGTGKTKVLTDRLLRLLLPQADGSPGAAPHKILCLTFTKAAANEMTLRLFDKLSQWAISSRDASFEGVGDTRLESDLKDLLGVPATALQIEAARTLFSKILDSPSGLKILTLHSFCQSVLKRFPLEAAVSPNFIVLEESESRDLIREAQRLVFEAASNTDYAGSDLQNAMLALTRLQNEEQFVDLVSQVSQERSQLLQLRRGFRNINSVYEAMCRFFEILPGQSRDAHIESAVFCDPDYEDRLKAVCLLLIEGVKTEIEKGQKVLDWLAKTPRERALDYLAYQNVFLNSDGGLYTRGFPSEGTKKKNTDAERILRTEGERLQQVSEVIKKTLCVEQTRDLLILAEAISASYENLKAERDALDYDDLIIKTHDLLSGQSIRFNSLPNQQSEDVIEVTPWVMYKLDQGLDHVLVDEAQDTNPEQWKIIEALTDEFFSTRYTGKSLRTVFVVGDIKQSIYSFQRAAPKSFVSTRQAIKEKVAFAGKELLEVPLRNSFRSSPPILSLVDAVFDREDLRQALGDDKIAHTSNRQGQAGRVELWPMIEGQKRERPDVWQAPVTSQNVQSPSAMLAQMIAKEVDGMVSGEDTLESHGRSVQPKDILILVRTRSTLVEELIRCLKKLKVPVSGTDRMILGSQLAVQDLLAAAKFALLPTDDLNLACLLKSPLIGWGDEELFCLATGRTDDLWSELVHYGAREYHRLLDDRRGLLPENVRTVTAFLRHLLNLSKKSGAYTFFSALLHMPCPGDPHSGMKAIKSRLGEDVSDPIEELLHEAIRHRRFHRDTLDLFVENFEACPKDIKREMAEGGGAVRIMTVHGSKGLQAPIVILPDTVQSTHGRQQPMLLWPDKTGLDFPLWTPLKDQAPKAFLDAFEHVRAKQKEESNRLLYVAMTRATDRLYVCGFKGSRSGADESWYDKIRKGFEKLQGVYTDVQGRLVYSEAQAEPPDKLKPNQVLVAEEVTSPAWIYETAPGEPDPPRPLVPSRATQEDDSFPVLSPLEAGQGLRFLRGNLTHKLLQFLPSFVPERQEEAARQYVETYGSDLTAEQRGSIVGEVLALISDPVTAPFFEAGGLAEVPVTALLDGGRILSGQIDRMVVRADSVWILDYKTNRPSPEDVSGVPKIYLRQMRAYRDAVRGIYPSKTVISALLWTDGPRLMILPDPELDMSYLADSRVKTDQ